MRSSHRHGRVTTYVLETFALTSGDVGARAGGEIPLRQAESMPDPHPVMGTCACSSRDVVDKVFASWGVTCN